ncbi:hypothetical protein BDR22DRAFT_821790 [Usnea florida]
MPKIVFQDPIYDMRAPRTPRRKSHDWEREVRRQNLVGSFSSWLKQHTAPKKSKRRSSAARRDLDRKGARSRVEDFFQDQCWTLSRVGSQPCCSSPIFEWGVYETMILWDEINRPWAVAGKRRLHHIRSESERDEGTVEEQHSVRRGMRNFSNQCHTQFDRSISPHFADFVHDFLVQRRLMPRPPLQTAYVSSSPSATPASFMTGPKTVLTYLNPDDLEAQTPLRPWLISAKAPNARTFTSKQRMSQVHHQHYPPSSLTGLKLRGYLPEPGRPRGTYPISPLLSPTSLNAFVAPFMNKGVCSPPSASNFGVTTFF